MLCDDPRRDIDDSCSVTLQGQGTSCADNAAIVGSSPQVQRMLDVVDRLAARDLTVLVTGETGTGKELVARRLHARSGRRNGPFVRVNCGAIPASLAESELFGHERGSFTGALRSHRGYFGRAHGGTLQLDEVEALPLEIQPKVLRALEVGEIQTVGSGVATRVDVRVVACTNTDLQAGIAAGWFRADLYYRLAVARIDVPPLRDRLEDIPELASHFVREAARRFGVGAVRLTGGALAALGAMSWPGNVRQLEHMITSMVALGDGADLDETSLSREGVGDRESAGQAGEGGAPRSLQERLEAVERSIICEALASCGNNRSQAARVLGMRRTTLLDRMARLGLRERGSSRRDDSTPAHPEVVS